MKSHKSSGIIRVAIAAALVIALAGGAIYLSSLNKTGAEQAKVDTQYFDMKVRPQDDLYRHVNGKWLDSTEIPADRSDYGAFSILYEENEKRLRDIVSKLQSDTQIKAGSDEQKIRDLYASFMNEEQLEKQGIKPIQNDLALVNAIQNKHDLAGAIATLARRGYNMPMVVIVHPDNKDSTRYVSYLSQAGLELPDRDYYLTDGDNGTYKKVREAYTKHIASLLRLAGFENVDAYAQDILEIETDIARFQWDKVTNRDPVKTYNRFEIKNLPELSAEIDWTHYLQTAGLTGKADVLVVQQPTYISGLGKQLSSLSLDKCKLLLKWKVISNSAPLLTRAMDNEDFEFNGKILSGQQRQRPRWKRALGLTDYAIGEGLGRIYVQQFFPDEDKRRVMT
ncbi:MAG TPA: M13 family metallopeptidase N-terminal domain-containing protein, partial [Steroidobacteraceae bacterium]|nr:M13 family metallopeptidase N-terminal domain-containing protein [Steroidobacteraceae bacterium]